MMVVPTLLRRSEYFHILVVYHHWIRYWFAFPELYCLQSAQSEVLIFSPLNNTFPFSSAFVFITVWHSTSEFAHCLSSLQTTSLSFYALISNRGNMNSHSVKYMCGWFTSQHYVFGDIVVKGYNAKNHFYVASFYYKQTMRENLEHYYCFYATLMVYCAWRKQWKYFWTHQ